MTENDAQTIATAEAYFAYSAALIAEYEKKLDAYAKMAKGSQWEKEEVDAQALPAALIVAPANDV